MHVCIDLPGACNSHDVGVQCVPARLQCVLVRVYRRSCAMKSALCAVVVAYVARCLTSRHGAVNHPVYVRSATWFVTAG